ncbi:hypothetical protein ACS0TY_006981 [Phlomoides rotata]
MMHLVMIRRWFYIISIFFSCCLSQGSDTISAGESLFPNQTIVSKLGKFELGFFSPGSSSNLFVGIWYKNIPVRTTVWVANRNNPIRSSPDNCRLQMSNGRLNLMVNSASIWMSQGLPYATEAVLFDSGNFVLINVSGTVWQSFDYPTDTWLPGATVGFRWSSNIQAKLISWRNIDNPASGNYSFGIVQDGGGELLINANGSHILWRSGTLQAGSFASLSGSSSYSFYYVKKNDTEYLGYNVFDAMIRFVIDYSGRMVVYVWSGRVNAWIVYSSQPSDYCKTYGGCGPNAICDIRNSPACGCLNGYEPRMLRNYDIGDFSDGCERRTPLDCAEDKTGFLKVNNIRLPANPELLDATRIGVCQSVCSRNCLCMAYGRDSRGECLLFTGKLLDLERLENSTAAGDLYVRIESRPLAKGGLTKKKILNLSTGKRNVLVVALVVSIGAAVITSCFCYFYPRRKLKNNESQVTHHNLLLYDLNPKEHVYNRRTSASNDLPIFSFSSIAASTNNFSTLKKLGEGGFGPVYKGELRNEQFVAVKRLSRRSGQGLEEFRNETELFAKLQHINLVAILGCCIENDEMILVYEYMPNKSLDCFLFDAERKEQLDWRKRVHIIQGIAQGLMYLHHYSRLRIVHRDLKASNILLDAEMNPKISDFGMARIFGGNNSQANTKRIVGTYGYMSPEYAMEGLFSVKSDVFAFGVLLLEILSGKKNTGFYGSAYLSLLGYAWSVWQNDCAIELIDSILEIPASSSCIALRCIQIGLLCVQDNPTDRPDMSQVVSMLNNKDSAIASPQHPAFTVGRILDKANPARSKVDICSVNGLTVTQMEAR